MSDQTLPIRGPNPVDATAGGPTVRPDLASGSTADGPAVYPPILPGETPAPPGYELLGELGRGGMGVVHRARDIALDREVAVKLLREAVAAGSPTVDRFLDEARITGQLQHPGIPAVYQVGHLPDGRPFLAMKLIRGVTLDDLLKANAPVNVPAVFEAVCQAVGYAHAHGVIHRDLKPQNIMVGSFGEVQVMDWGLAKLLTTCEVLPRRLAAPLPDDGTHIKSVRDSDGSVTEAGSVMGTPAYMPPEQAAGDGDRIDRRSDVFGLGAVLCRLLTGLPPFAGESSEAIRRNAAAGNTADALARLDRCGADPELVVLCMRCLSVDPAARPPDAQELAAEMAKLRAAADDRAKRSELDRARAEVHAAEQRTRRRQTVVAVGGLAAVLLVGVVGTTVGMIRASRAEAEVRQSLADTQAAQTDAEVARDQARRRYDLALAAFDDMIFAIQKRLATRPGTLELRKDLLTGARAGLKKLAAEAEQSPGPDRSLVWSYYRMGTVEETLGNFDAAVREFETGHALAERLAAATPDDMDAQADRSTGLMHLGSVALQRKDTDRALKLFQAKFEIDTRVAAAAPTNLTRQRNLGVALSRLGEVSLMRGDVPAAHEYHGQKLRLAQQVAATRPADPELQRDVAVAYELLGDSAGYSKRPEQVVECYAKMYEIMGQLLAADPENIGRKRDASVALGKLGNAFEDAGRPRDALGYYLRAVELLRQMADADPRNVQAQTDLFIAYDNLGSTREALRDYAAAAETYRQGRAVIQPLHERRQLVGQFQTALADVTRKIAACERRATRREVAPPPRAGR